MDGEEGVGEHDARDVPVPRPPLADLVLIQTCELLSLLVLLFDLPSGAGLHDRFGGRGARGSVDQEVRVLEADPPADGLLLAGGATDQQLVFESVGRFQTFDADSEAGPVVEAPF